MSDLPPGPPPAMHVPNTKRDKPKRPGGAAPKGWSKEPIPDEGAHCRGASALTLLAMNFAYQETYLVSIVTS